MPASAQSCIVTKWSYDPRRKLLTCVCLVNGLTNLNGTLVRTGPNMLAIPAIPPSGFASNYLLLVRTKSDALRHVWNMFSTQQPKDAVVIHVACKPPGLKRAEHNCTALYQYADEVSWDYPEYGSDPVRNLKELERKVFTKDIEFIGMRWPELLDADIVRIILRLNPDTCGTYLQSLTDEILKTKTKCRVEFTEQDEAGQLIGLARLSLFAPVETEVKASLKVESYKLANRLKYLGTKCDTPVQIRNGVLSYGKCN
ncbi:unnamed protein product [Dicrocoelium dendriticum]|nr:unnamed protein product [Dicrocoelium dendriticum]